METKNVETTKMELNKDVCKGCGFEIWTHTKAEKKACETNAPTLQGVPDEVDETDVARERERVLYRELLGEGESV